MNRLSKSLSCVFIFVETETILTICSRTNFVMLFSHQPSQIHAESFPLRPLTSQFVQFFLLAFQLSLSLFLLEFLFNLSWTFREACFSINSVILTNSYKGEFRLFMHYLRSSVGRSVGLRLSVSRTVGRSESFRPRKHLQNNHT